MGLKNLKSKVLIVKANMQVIVLKSVWGLGSCPRGHVSMQKNISFPGVVILMMLNISKGKQVI